MRALAKRLRALEQRFGPEVASAETMRVLARLEAARRRCSLPPISPERQAELRGMSVAPILICGRQKVAMARRATLGLDVPLASMPEKSGENR
jgi:hypothetical protein